MLNQHSNRLRIFLALEQEHRLRQNSASQILNDIDRNSAETISPVTAYLSDSEVKAFNRMSTEYQNKSEEERKFWRQQILGNVSSGVPSIDKNIHHSHIDQALAKETPAVRNIVIEWLNLATNGANMSVPAEAAKKALKKTVCRTFADQFVSPTDLKKATAFDRLSGTQLARLIRLSGIREVALACVRIEAVESVGAFLRRFSAEDARAVATQINSLRDTADTRLSFAENLVQAALEAEQHPPAMLDLAGMSLVGVLLCESSKPRIFYTSQKLPIEIAPKLIEVAGEEYRKTSKLLQRQIAGEIEHLADRILQTTATYMRK